MMHFHAVKWSTIQSWNIHTIKHMQWLKYCLPRTFLKPTKASRNICQSAGATSHVQENKQCAQNLQHIHLPFDKFILSGKKFILGSSIIEPACKAFLFVTIQLSSRQQTQKYATDESRIRIRLYWFFPRISTGAEDFLVCSRKVNKRSFPIFEEKAQNWWFFNTEAASQTSCRTTHYAEQLRHFSTPTHVGWDWCDCLPNP